MNFDQLFSGKALLFGFLVWLIPFMVGFVTFPVKSNWPLAFKTIMAIVLVAATVGLTRAYFLSITPMDATQGLLLGCLWAVICIAIDVPVFIFGFKMKAVSYFTEIGIAYLIVPMITWGSASLAAALLQKP